MIPHRMLSNEINGHGLKERVTACRKRLRVNRVTHRAPALDGADELFPELEPAISEFQSSTTHYPGPPTLVRMNYSPAMKTAS